MLGYRYGWHSLLADNGALRVLLNGRLLTVPETFHDWALQERLVTPPRTFAARVRLIGELMGEYPVGVPDWWWAARLDALLAR